MKQEKLLEEVEKINLKIAALKSIISDFEVDKMLLLTKCKHKDGSGNSAIDENGVCWICAKNAINR